MASKNIYFGDVNGIARPIKKLFFGDENGIAREIKKVLYGDENGMARLVYAKDIRPTHTVGLLNYGEVYRDERISNFVDRAQITANMSYTNDNYFGGNNMMANQNLVCFTNAFVTNRIKAIHFVINHSGRHGLYNNLSFRFHTQIPSGWNDYSGYIDGTRIINASEAYNYWGLEPWYSDVNDLEAVVYVPDNFEGYLVIQQSDAITYIKSIWMEEYID